jgi:hypothetical protein
MSSLFNKIDYLCNEIGKHVYIFLQDEDTEDETKNNQNSYGKESEFRL